MADLKKTTEIHPALGNYITGIIEEAGLIPPKRRELLDQLARYLLKKSEKNEAIALNFICTHNSRRSQISQIWAATAAAFYGLERIETFSGGTEATAFNSKAVAAMERTGFHIENQGGPNPRYLVSFAPDAPVLTCFSKTFDDPYNPKQGFAAIMTCSDADANCPFVPGAEWRLSLPYDDPKEADDTPEETERYDEKVRQIGREIFYTFKHLHNHFTHHKTIQLL